MSAATETVRYDDATVRKFIAASMVFGIVGMLAGVVVALQLAWWPANVHPTLSFGRLRPLHTNAVIFAFVGNMIFAGVYYSTQRLTKTAMASPLLSKLHFWGWQAIIVAAAVSLPLGYTQAKEYAELEWPIDLAIAVVWIIFAVNFFWTLVKRRQKQLYVALWFYIATIVAITVLHVVNSLALPVGPLKSYSVFGGVQDALVQWWYGHNAVAFFLTTPVLGIMYYFIPKAADRPVYSYRLSIVHFWSLVFIYIWAGPHHLLYTALPDWAQSLGMIFSLMLWAPSWGGMLNGLLTLRGAWEKLRADPVLKFFAAGVTFYGMATFEGPLLSIKSVSGLAHYTDWIIAHVHAGALGWNGLMAAGMFYWLVPKLYRTKLHSVWAANAHFWLSTLGILLYVLSMWTAGIQQGLMWRATNAGGGLMYPNFLESLAAIRPLYWTRLVGGSLYLGGFVVMAWNLIKTAASGTATETEVEVPARAEEDPDAEPALAGRPWWRLVLAPPVLVGCLAMCLAVGIGVGGPITAILAACVLAMVTLAAIMSRRTDDSQKTTWHALVEGQSGAFTLLTIGAVLVGGVAEIVPSVVGAPDAAARSKNVPYSALELEGRDVYLREGCYTCHSQMIRPFTWETKRYGQVSDADDSIFDHPFQWGSRRIGPDLARLGQKYSNTWHYRHMINPRAISAGSNMPPYAHLAHEPVDFNQTQTKLRAMRTLGVPYGPQDIAKAPASAKAQAVKIAKDLQKENGIKTCETPTAGCDLAENSRLVALIAYLQRIGKVPANPQVGSKLAAGKKLGEKPGAKGAAAAGNGKEGK